VSPAATSPPSLRLSEPSRRGITGYRPLVINHRRLAGGNFEVTWSIAPGTRVKRVIPVEAYNEGTIAELTHDIESRHT
jgi:hypothetical protein